MLLCRQLCVEEEEEEEAGTDEKDGNADIQGDSGGGGSGGGEGGGSQGSKNRRPICSAEGCQQQSQTDSKFCCDECGIRHAEAKLSDALRHSVEVRVGLERGRRLRETRELKVRKQQVRAGLKSTSVIYMHDARHGSDWAVSLAVRLKTLTYRAGEGFSCENVINVGCVRRGATLFRLTFEDVDMVVHVIHMKKTRKTWRFDYLSWIVDMFLGCKVACTLNHQWYLLPIAGPSPPHPPALKPLFALPFFRPIVHPVGIAIATFLSDWNRHEKG